MLRQRAIKLHFHVAGTLEFFKDNLIHLRARLNKSRCQDGKASAALDIAGSAQKLLRRIQRRRINATRKDTT